MLCISWSQQESSDIGSFGLGETKPREMNEAHSWQKTPCEALKNEQLKGPESRSSSAWNGKNQLLGGGECSSPLENSGVFFPLCVSPAVLGGRGPAWRSSWHWRPQVGLTPHHRAPGVSGPIGCGLCPSSTTSAVDLGPGPLCTSPLGRRHCQLRRLRVIPGERRSAALSAPSCRARVPTGLFSRF